ncbi:MAG TPA: ATP-binding protein [Candidatus Kapabacteria bacterium]|nr:ATP-binding protein [Candidatus Kapabacteria bacterium]
MSWPRNRLMADLMSKTFFMERVGTGIERIRRFCRENNNEIKIKPTGPHFFVKRTKGDMQEKLLTPGLGEHLRKAKIKVLSFFRLYSLSFISSSSPLRRGKCPDLIS